MKQNLSFQLSIFIIISSCLLSHCNKDTVQSETDKIKALLKGTWKVQTVTVDGTDQTTLYKTLTLSFTDTGYTTSNGANVWPVSGTWSFTDTTGKTLLRNDGVTIYITETTTAKLILSFTWGSKTIGPGRVESVVGNHIFTFFK